MSEFEANPAQQALIYSKANETYHDVSTNKRIKLQDVHKSPYCVDITRILADKLPTHWNVLIRNVFEAGLGSGEVPMYGHSFLEIGSKWAVDGGWQLFWKIPPYYKD